MKIPEEKNFIKISQDFFETQEWKKRRIFSEIEAILYLILKKEIRISARRLGLVFGWSKAKVVIFIQKLIAKGYIKRRIEEKVNVLTIIKFLKKEKHSSNYKKNNNNEMEKKYIDSGAIP
ncbi:hypothetical protein BLBBOR_p001 (plasmid) [Blattabacterium sp. (Blatta orientalis) str. Tarazona]|uniref:MarR family transcriptional regulator n=1 Tax=Blattabacterium sp. (Blatta orientalis) TaxID=367806 RepID=UPI0002AD8F50|nr:MarR family transcriptional regulator [Blattabacterium sp. (Blatta orientalis)]AGD98488.1 hypothetical protein BLBBOR_p001 [Blattabacterium sp. (Blatta orientalis) str. Tarazona]